MPYPDWFYYPDRERPPDWVEPFIEVVAAAAGSITSGSVSGLTSDKVLAVLRPGLEEIGYRVESGKTKEDRITLPVLFGDQGRARVRYDVDAVHDALGVIVEVEAGRGARGNAVYRDLVLKQANGAELWAKIVACGLIGSGPARLSLVGERFGEGLRCVEFTHVEGGWFLGG